MLWPIGSSLSFYLIGALHGALPWRTAVGAAVAGPAAAWLLVFSTLRPAARRASPETGHWNRVLRSGPAMQYVAGYAAHMWELFALRAWLGRAGDRSSIER